MMFDIPESLKWVHKNPEFWAMVKRGKDQIARGESRTICTLDELQDVIAARANKDQQEARERRLCCT